MRQSLLPFFTVFNIAERRVVGGRHFDSRAVGAYTVATVPGTVSITSFMREVALENTELHRFRGIMGVVGIRWLWRGTASCAIGAVRPGQRSRRAACIGGQWTAAAFAGTGSRRVGLLPGWHGAVRYGRGRLGRCGQAGQRPRAAIQLESMLFLPLAALHGGKQSRAEP